MRATPFSSSPSLSEGVPVLRRARRRQMSNVSSMRDRAQATAELEHLASAGERTGRHGARRERCHLIAAELMALRAPRTCQKGSSSAMRSTAAPRSAPTRRAKPMGVAWNSARQRAHLRDNAVFHHRNVGARARAPCADIGTRCRPAPGRHATHSVLHRFPFETVHDSVSPNCRAGRLALPGWRSTLEISCRDTIRSLPRGYLRSALQLAARAKQSSPARRR